ncbi:MAG: biosynthetic arginine decarboxylase [Gammaproteobacteria bacterium]|nr:biosynthetic arginine decarboxylase [Gammaproteobacteria bacterium]
MADWSTEQARRVYNLDHWGAGFFDINTNGDLLVRPALESASSINLPQLIDEIKDAGLRFPVLVRFPDILKQRIQQLCHAFADAAHQLDYQARHTAVYPIKVNQQRCVVDEILLHGGERVGLEAGSKPELMAVLAVSKPDSVIVCNGYKDREYIRLALIGQKLGHRVYIVVEKPTEIELILQLSRELVVEPLIGVRLRLASMGKGKWQNSGGEKAKFGLSAAQVLNMVEYLEQRGSLQYLKLLHFHMGSQIANIHDLQGGLQEAARHFSELSKLGAKLEVLDVGGGLAVDYDGTRSRNHYSMNYSVQEYALNVLKIIKATCDDNGLAHPQVITESGRAMTAHHAMLISNVIETEAVQYEQLEPPEPDAPLPLAELWRVYQGPRRSSIELYHDAQYWFEQAQAQYTLGSMNLEQRAEAERLYFAICKNIQQILQAQNRASEVLDEINEKLADKYFCNFSVFQSMPDVWGIGQVFPIVPIHRLHERPDRRGIVHDLTCDSDGQIEFYPDSEGIETTLPLHKVKPDEEYWLGMFLLGAYQEILGDMHNLFGDTDAINVMLNEDGSHKLYGEEFGDSIEELLTYVHFDIAAMLQSYQHKINAAGLSEEEKTTFFHEMEEGIKGYTYFEKE